MIFRKSISADLAGRLAFALLRVRRGDKEHSTQQALVDARNEIVKQVVGQAGEDVKLALLSAERALFDAELDKLVSGGYTIEFIQEPESRDVLKASLRARLVKL